MAKGKGGKNEGGNEVGMADAPTAAPAAEGGAEGHTPGEIDPAILAKIAELRSHMRESFGKVTMAMMMLPRYRSQTLADLQHLVLEPLVRDRIAIAYSPEKEKTTATDVAGMAIWASVSEEVDGRIREQIKAGTFPVRLKADDWASGEINWLLDVIAPDQRAAASVIANFRQVVKQGSLRLHPLITRLVDEEALQKMGAERMPAAGAAVEERAPEGETVN